MEDGVRAILNAWRPQMLEELAGAASQEVELCPSCGNRMQRRGTRSREVVTDGDQLAELDRPYWTCLHCQMGLFPPG
jgi:YgiT-type zinc finger domain-containing protein